MNKGVTIRPTIAKVTEIAKDIRTELKEVQHATFSVRCNRQWETLKEEPRTVIYVKGGYSVATNSDYSLLRQASDKVREIVYDTACIHGYTVIENEYTGSYTLVKYL